MTTTTLEAPPNAAPIPAETVAEWLRSGEAVLIDVREPFEHAAEHIPQARLHPLSALNCATLQRSYPNRRIIFHCRSGKRSNEAASQFAAAGGECAQLAGGIEGWKTAGLAVERSAGAPRIDVMRQVQMVAGTLVLGGVVLGAFVSPWFLILSGFVGAGLIFAGASGWCGMAKLLALMPWNRVAAANCETNCSTATQ